MIRFLHHRYHLKYKHVYRHAKKLFIFDLALILLALAMFSSALYFFIWRPGLTDLVDLNLSINRQRIISGDQIELTIHYKNRSKQDLLFPRLQLEFPVGFVIDRLKIPTTSLSEELIWKNFENIKANSDGNFKIYGWIWSTPKIFPCVFLDDGWIQYYLR